MYVNGTRHTYFLSYGGVGYIAEAVLNILKKAHTHTAQNYTPSGKLKNL